MNAPIPSTPMEFPVPENPPNQLATDFDTATILERGGTVMRSVTARIQADITYQCNERQSHLNQIARHQGDVEKCDHAILESTNLGADIQQLWSHYESVVGWHQEMQLANRRMEKTVESKDSKISNLEREVKRMEKTVEIRESKTAILERQVKSMEKTVESRESKVATIQGEVETLKKASERKDVEIEAMKKGGESLDSEIKKLNSIKHKLEDDLKAARKQVSDHEEKHANAVKEASKNEAKHTSAIQERDDQLRSLRDDKSELSRKNREQIIELEKRLDEIDKGKAELNNTRTRLQEEKRELSAELATVRQARFEIEEERHKTQIQLTQATGAYTALQETSKTQAQQLAVSLEANQEKDTKIAELEDHVSKADNMVAAMQVFQDRRTNSRQTPSVPRGGYETPPPPPPPGTPSPLPPTPGTAPKPEKKALSPSSNAGDKPITATQERISIPLKDSCSPAKGKGSATTPTKPTPLPGFDGLPEFKKKPPANVSSSKGVPPNPRDRKRSRQDDTGHSCPQQKRRC